MPLGMGPIKADSSLRACLNRFALSEVGDRVSGGTLTGKPWQV